MSDGELEHDYNMQNSSKKPSRSTFGGGGPPNHKRSGGMGRERGEKGERGLDGPTDDASVEIYRELMREKEDLDPKEFPEVHRLIDKELARMERRGGSDFFHQHETVDLYNDPPITLSIKCFPPIKEFPNFNYAGRIIGPKGAYLKAIMRETNTKMVLLGAGVMKDKEKEEELKNSSDPKYFHLRDDMHVSITVTGSASEAYNKAGRAIDCLKRQVVSDNKELLRLPWIVRVLENGDGPPQAYQQLETLGRSKYGSPPPPPPSHYRRRESGSHGHSGYYEEPPYPPPSRSSGHRHQPSYSPPPPVYVRGGGGGKDPRYYDPPSPKRTRPTYARSPPPYDYDEYDYRESGKRSAPPPRYAAPPPHRTK